VTGQVEALELDRSPTLDALAMSFATVRIGTAPTGAVSVSS
jgi:hypothetical protein